MKRVTLSLFSFALVLATLVPLESTAGQQRRVAVRHARVVVRRPVVRTRLVVRNGYPIRRVLPATVVVRPARRVVTVGAPLVFLPSVDWSSRVVAMPAGNRLVWQDSESIGREEGWVDSNFGIDSEGNALFLQIYGSAELNFAEVTFANGNVQVVDFNGSTHGTGVYALLDFADGRHVKTVRLLAKSASNDTDLAIYLSK
ncbi:MAG: hypothetical protein ND895_11020 [Pyrinomonadaceae bacterium]|nr:hypothetical protein [Pyrinomonadaceae bacterium]